MALSALTVWEVRPTVGSDTNGGAFVAGASGTDYSQQDAKNTAGNNISTTDVVAAGTTTITSATASFTSAIVGNIIYLAGGSGSLAASWYQVTAFTNSTTITVDRTVATGTGITMNIGGAMATISQAYSNSVAGNTCYVKASGTYTVTASLTLTLSNEAGANEYKFIGYTMTRGDGGRVTWTTATNSTPLLKSGGTGAHNHAFENFNFTTTAATPAACFDGALAGAMMGLRLTHCKISGGFTQGVKGAFNAGVNWDIGGIVLDGVEVTGCTDYGVGCSGASLIYACYIHGNSSHGIKADSTSSSTNGGAVVVCRSVVYNNGGSGINLASSTDGLSAVWPIVINSAIVGNTGDGLTLSPNYAPVVVVDTVIESNGGYGMKFSAGLGSVSFRNNAYRNNTSGATFNTSQDASDLNLTAEPFTSPSTGDFSLNSTAGGGAACKAAGYPTTIPGA